MLNKSLTLSKFGYDFSKLSMYSEKIVCCKCDYCGLEFDRQYGKINKSKKFINKDCCSDKKCINSKRNETFLLKYSEGHPFKNKNIRDKIKQTNIQKYGVDNASRTENIKNKIKQTNIQKYGVDYPLKLKHIKEKQKNTNIQKYGVPYCLQNKNIREKVHITCEKRYGTKYPSQNSEIKEKLSKKMKLLYGVDYPSQIHMGSDIVEKLSNKEWLIQEHHINKKCLTQIAVDLGLSATSKTIADACKRHDIEIKKYIVSSGEKEILEYIISLGFADAAGSCRTEISPQELDIYIPSKKIAIEYCGLYWHSNIYKDRKYHQNKMNLCKSKGIRLITIFEDEWLYKKDLVKNKLKYILGLEHEKIFARKCIVEKDVEIKDFLNENHFQGYCASTYNYTLKENGIVVATMTFGKPRFTDKYQYELIRYASSKNVVGGASKLFQAFIKDMNPTSIISYCDLRWGIGKLYDILGFKESHTSEPNYFYIKNQKRISRYNLTKKKLNILYPELIGSEKEITEKLDLPRIYDCGNKVFIWNNQ